jgi:superfamily I DNA/RNA helicase
MLNNILIPTDEQIQVYDCNEDYIVISACAGSGKSTSLVHKAKIEAKRCKPWQYIQILSFTKKSSQDITNKLMDSSFLNIHVSTFHAFIISEILVFDKRFSNYPNFDYGRKVDSLDKWLDIVEKENILSSSVNPKDDFIFNYALKLINKRNVREYLNSKFKCIYVDEAQDNNYLQYSLLEEFMKIGLRLLLVGDEKQTLYGFRGADQTLFKSLCQDRRYHHFKLTRNFRCNVNINDVANSYNFPTSDCLDVDGDGVYVFLGDVASILDIHKNEPVSILRSKNSSLNSYGDRVKVINDFNFGFNVTTFQESVLTGLIKLFYNSEYNLFDFLDDFFLYSDKPSNASLKVIKACIKGFISDLSVETLEVINDFLLLNLDEKQMHDFILLLEKNIPKEYFSNKTDLYSTRTIHSAKGLEFDNVIIFRGDFYYNNKLNEELFYVAVTRARNKLYIVI